MRTCDAWRIMEWRDDDDYSEAARVIMTRIARMVTT